MAGDLYQSPSFAWLHAIRDAGASGLAFVDSITAATPETWLIDNQARRLIVWSASGTKQINIDRGAGPLDPVDRLIIPSGHNLQGCAIGFYSNVSGFGTPTDVLPYSRLRGAVSLTQPTTIHPGVFVLDFPSTPNRYLSVVIGGNGSLVPQIGELWLTRRETPTVGYETDYEYSTEPNVAASTLRSGAVSTIERGPTRRTAKVSTWGISGTDRKLYDRMLADCGVARDPVWIDPTFGFYETSIDTMESSPHTSWVTTGGTDSTASGVKFAGSSSLALAAAGAAVVTSTLDFTNADLRGCILKLAVQSQTNRTYATATDGFRVTLSTNGASANSSTWYFGTDIVTANAVFSMLSIDLDNEAPDASTGNGCDLSSIGRITVTFGRTGVTFPSAQNLYIDDVHYLDKRAEPWCARIADAGAWKQTSNVPIVGEHYSRTLSFEESIG